MQHSSSRYIGGRAGSVSSVRNCVFRKGLIKLLVTGQVVAAQFPTKLESYTEELITQKNGFQVAMVMQIAVDVDTMGMWFAFLTSLFCLTSDF